MKREGGREGGKTEEGEESIKLHTARWKGLRRGSRGVRERWKERGKKGLEDRHRDEEQDALRDASSQKGRSRVCTAHALRVGPARKSRAEEWKKERRFAGWFLRALFSPV